MSKIEWVPWVLIWILAPFLYSEQFLDPSYSLRDLLCVSAALIIGPVILLQRQKLAIPQLNKIGVMFVFLLILLYLYISIFLPSELSFIPYLAYVIFVAFLAFNQMHVGENHFFRNLSHIIGVSSILVLLLSTFQLIYCHLNPGFALETEHLGSFSGYFGNINILAQFLAITTPFQILLVNGNTGKLRTIYLVVLCWCLAILAFTFCRSAILASMLSLFFFAIYLRKTKLFLYAALPYLLVLNFLIAPQVTPKYQAKTKGKVSSLYARLDLIQSGLNIAQDFPLGTGVGKYAYNTLPYRFKDHLYISPHYNARSPHFEPIKLLVETGIPGFLIVAGAVIFLLFNYLKRLRVQYDQLDVLAVSLIITLGIEALTQFPFEMIHPLTVLGLCLAFILRKLFNCKWVTASPWTRISTFSLGLLITALYFFSFHKNMQIDYLSPNFTTYACKHRLIDWRRCLDFSKSLLKEDRKRSDELLTSLVHNNPFNTFIVNEISFRQGLDGKNELSCLGASIQKEIYRGFSFFGRSFWDTCDISNKEHNKDILGDLKIWIYDSDLEIHPVFQAALQSH